MPDPKLAPVPSSVSGLTELEPVLTTVPWSRLTFHSASEFLVMPLTAQEPWLVPAPFLRPMLVPELTPTPDPATTSLPVALGRVLALIPALESFPASGPAIMPLPWPSLATNEIVALIAIARALALEIDVHVIQANKLQHLSWKWWIQSTLHQEN